MKKKKILLLVILIMCFTITNVDAKTTAEVKADINTSLTNYKFEAKYADLSSVITYLKTGDTELSRRLNMNNPYAILLSNIVRNDLEKKVDFTNIGGIDLFCFLKGDTRTVFNETTNQFDDIPVDKTFCEANFYISIGEENDSVTKNLDITFTKVDGDAKLSERALNLVKQLNKPVYIYDIDVINHYINYDKPTSSFFSSDNSLYEFSELKKVKETNKEFDLYVGFEDTRRGIGNVGIAEGSTVVAKDGIIYGFTYNSYNVGNVYVVPSNTPVEDFEETLEKRLKEYVKGTNTTIEVLPYESRYLPEIYDVGEMAPKLFGVSTQNFYVNAHTTAALQKVKVDLVEDGYGCDDDTKCIAGYVRRIKINNKIYEIDIIPYDIDKLNNVGTISSVDYKTGIILKTNSNNIPLDASLNTQVLELSKEDKEVLKKNGYSAVGGYDLKLYSKILDKYISNFNSSSTVLIPVDDYTKDMEIVYVNDDNEVEKYTAKLVNIDGKKYLSFKTLHFSNYYIVNKTGTISNPKTNDSINMYILFGMISLIGLGLTELYKKRIG